MNNEKNSGGPAFPVPNDANVNRQEGMTLRDYFAAKAMHAILSNWGSLAEYNQAAPRAYAMADAMLKAREQ